MKWLLVIVVVFSILTIFELHKEYNKYRISKKIYKTVIVIESVVAVISFVLLLAMK